jgi:hypothetical protein
MAERHIQYSGHDIVIDEAAVRLAIDGETVQVERQGDAFLTYVRPYEQFLSLAGLAQTLIDDGDVPGGS